MSAGYSADGLRARKTVHDKTTYFLYNRRSIALQLDATGNVTHYTVYGPMGLLAQVNAKTSDQIWYLFDHLGNVEHRLDAAGKVISTDQYDAWGNLITGDDMCDPYGYQGQIGYYKDYGAEFDIMYPSIL